MNPRTPGEQEERKKRGKKSFLLILSESCF
uniref:Uncharacterized protein n=1 Tax=Rhizophora mucronata TaxID=61149 RepID=A0A2P2N7P2_RHIMU